MSGAGDADTLPRPARTLAEQARAARGASPELVELVVSEALTAEQAGKAGKASHGLGKLLAMELGDLRAESVHTELGSLLVVDGGGGVLPRPPPRG